MRAKAWSETSLGPVASWPQSLRTAVGMMLPLGPAELHLLGPRARHALQRRRAAHHRRQAPGGPRAEHQGGAQRGLARPPAAGGGRDRHGKAVYLENLLIPLERFGFVQDGYYTFSYLPIRIEGGGVGGIFVVVMETTGQVVDARRLALIRELSIRSALCQNVASVLRSAEEVLGQAPFEVPFALLYARSGSAPRSSSAWASSGGSPLRPRSSDGQEGSAWPLAEVARSRSEVLCRRPRGPFRALPGGPSGEPAARALVLPLAADGEGEVTFVLVVGLNPRIPWTTTPGASSSSSRGSSPRASRAPGPSRRRRSAPPSSRSSTTRRPSSSAT